MTSQRLVHERDPRVGSTRTHASQLRLPHTRAPLLSDACILSVQFGCVLLLNPRPLLVLALLSALSGLRLLRSRDRHQTLTWCLGASLGSGADALQVAAGVYTYANPSFLLPGYMLPLWGQIFLVLRGVLRAIDDRADSPWKPLRLDGASAGVTSLFVVATASVCLLHPRPVLVAAICITVAILIFLADHRPGDGLACGLAAVLGPVSEGILVHGGIYHFPESAFFGLPAWHPFYWMVCVLFLRRLRGRVEAEAQSRADKSEGAR